MGRPPRKKPKIKKKVIVSELIRCGEDPIYFLETYARIEHPKQGVIPFKLFDYQKDVVKACLENRFNILLKARQLGLTTIIAGFMAWLLIFHKHQNILILASKQEKSKIPLRVVKNIRKYLPPWMRKIFARKDTDNALSLELENGSRIKAIATSSDAGIGEAVSFLFIDECAHINNLGSMWAQVFPTLSVGGRSFITSTPAGASGFFFDLWTKARNGEGNFNCRFGKYVNPTNPNEIYDDRLMWWVRPGCDQEWFERETADQSGREIAQERECKFLASGDTFIDSETIERLEYHTRPPNGTYHLDRNVWVWEEPEKNGVYIISADISRGDSHDYSAFHVLRIDGLPLKQVAEYKGKIRPDQLGELLVEISVYYNNAVIAPENNSGWAGQAVLRIQESNCGNLYYSRKRPPKVKQRWVADPYYAQNRNDYLPGYSVTVANRLPMLSKLEQYVRTRDVEINSTRTTDEFKTFIVNANNKPEAQRGCNDDLVMALAGGLWIRDESFLHIGRTDDLAMIMADSMSTSTTDTRQFRDFNYGGSIYDKNRIVDYVEDRHKIVLGNGEHEDISWLLIDKG